MGTLHDKAIVWKADEMHIDRFDFIIHGLDSVKVKKSRSYMRNPFDLQEPRFYGDTILKSFNRTKIVTAEIIYQELTALIKKYE